MTKDEAMKLALEALEKVNARSVIMGSTGDYRDGQLDALSAVSKDAAPAITALREALADQPAPCEPADDGVCEALDCPNHKPAQRTWVGLTDDELSKFDVDPIEAKLMIAKLKEKNT